MMVQRFSAEAQKVAKGVLLQTKFSTRSVRVVLRIWAQFALLRRMLCKSGRAMALNFGTTLPPLIFFELSFFGPGAREAANGNQKERQGQGKAQESQQGDAP